MRRIWDDALKGAGAVVLSFGLASDALAQDNAAGAAPIAPSGALPTFTIPAGELDAESAFHCEIYTTVLDRFDQEHFSGPTNMSHQEMATIAMDSILKSAMDVDMEAFESTEQIGQFVDTRLNTVTFDNGVEVTFPEAPADLDSYEAQCHFLQAPVNVISSITGIEEVELTDTAINAVIRATRDPHSSFIGASDLQEMQEQTSGQFAGVGLNIMSYNGFIRIEEAVEGGPSENLGFETGDLITHGHL